MIDLRTTSFLMVVLFSLADASSVPGQTVRSDALSLHALFGAGVVAENVNAVRREAASLSVESRYEYLKNWVLPSETHPDFRVVGEFTPTDPSPLARQFEPHRFQYEQGGELVSPLFDLLEAAKTLERLDVLAQELKEIQGFSQQDQLRASLIVQLLIDLEKAEPNPARNEWMMQLSRLVIDSFKDSGRTDQFTAYSPELILIVRAMSVHSEFQLIGDLLSALYAERASISRSTLFQSHLHSQMMQYLDALSEKNLNRTNSEPDLKNWIPVTQTIAMSRGEGYPQTRWMFDEDENLTLAEGNHEAYLFYRLPLIGRYEVVGEMTAHGVSQILVGGRFNGTHGDRKHLVSGSFRAGGQLLEIEYHALPHESTIQYRAVSDEREVRVSVNGLVCMTYPHDQIIDPWVGLRSMPTGGASYRSLAISGSPEVPEEIEMISSPTLNNWIPYSMHTEYVGTPRSHWKIQNDPVSGAQLIGRQRQELQGSWQESLLRYHRPLVEDGSIEYEFLYIPGRYEAHPCLDRLVFLLDPDGVKLHWLTDGKFDRTAITPDNAIVESGNQRGPERLPLSESGWNHLKVSISGQLVSLVLNGQLIYERELESPNRRTFGLFHYADRSELWVRRAVMRGDWPKELPLVHKQELTDPAMVAADQNLEHLTTEFSHNFSKEGLPESCFRTPPSNSRKQIVIEPGGVRATVLNQEGWSDLPIVMRFGVQGDFDIQAHLSELNTDEVKHEAAAFIDIRTNDVQQHIVRSMRYWTHTTGHSLNAQISPRHLNGHRTWMSQFESEAASNGTLRISRIGKRILFSFAEADSDVFRVMRDEVVTDSDVPVDGIKLMTAMLDGQQTTALWKNITIKAEGITYQPPGQAAEVKQLPSGAAIHSSSVLLDSVSRDKGPSEKESR